MNRECVLMAHGGGGEMTRALLEKTIIPLLTNPYLDPLTDGALLDAPGGRLCVTTDASVVQPLFFPGGDIGRLAVCGTINDLSVMGARPLVLTQTLIIEEGLPLETLERIVASISETSRETGVPVVSGDTKVIERRRGDGLLISTSGLGVVPFDLCLGLDRVRPSDRVLLSGTVADHGLAIMASREGLELESGIESDVAALHELCASLLTLGDSVRFLRDPTRGGLAGVLADISEGSGCSVEVEEESIPMRPSTRHAAEVLGLDPLAVANEGKVVAVVEASAAHRALELLHAHPLGRDAAVIGKIVDRKPPLVELITRSGGMRIVTRPHGEELPRIC